MSSQKEHLIASKDAFKLEQLEPRILFSADPLGVAPATMDLDLFDKSYQDKHEPAEMTAYLNEPTQSTDVSLQPLNLNSAENDGLELVFNTEVSPSFIHPPAKLSFVFSFHVAIMLQRETSRSWWQHHSDEDRSKIR